ncbi:DNA methyltransferase family protein [Fibrobacter intestinalis]|uniref:N-6 DNA Methylase n=1 Tax=Fibrobacter intestinalis TaxID=28122 RepID=A0A1T4Q7L2_9BACT|nr:MULTISPECIES: SAM-dependent DNA methyltransferase [Fibrobacter]PBC74077.1 hypothetical protein BGW94_1715 [Fibrobacter sp. NR9]SJZ99646.1 hypothetical protein SAMN02745108_02194 [Fibrobacter intestinalis]
MTNQIISKERVAQNGEVFTAPREVNAMLDLVQGESYRIDSKFLEPSAGTGNFLVEILRRKLKTAKDFATDQAKWENAALRSLASIYSIELMEDNVETSRKRLYEIFQTEYESLFVNSFHREISKAAKFIIETNTICGDTLKMLRADGTPIAFTEWNFKGEYAMRRLFTLQSLIEWNRAQEAIQGNLFAQELLPQKVHRPTKIKNLKDK